MHTRHSRAAVDTTEVRRPAAPRPTHTITLWAERPLSLRQGQLIAVRLRGDQLQVRLVDRDSGLSSLHPAECLISEVQATHWVATSQFTR